MKPAPTGSAADATSGLAANTGLHSPRRSAGRRRGTPRPPVRVRDTTSSPSTHGASTTFARGLGGHLLGIGRRGEPLAGRATGISHPGSGVYAGSESGTSSGLIHSDAGRGEVAGIGRREFLHPPRVGRHGVAVGRGRRLGLSVPLDHGGNRLSRLGRHGEPIGHLGHASQGHVIEPRRRDVRGQLRRGLVAARTLVRVHRRPVGYRREDIGHVVGGVRAEDRLQPRGVLGARIGRSAAAGSQAPATSPSAAPRATGTSSG